MAHGVGFSGRFENDAYLVLLDRDGKVRWLARSRFDETKAAELRAVVTAFAETSR
jgi:hypothetical protein